MRTFAPIAGVIVCLLMISADALVYTFDTLQGWTSNGAAYGIANLRASQGRMAFDYVLPTITFDPQVTSPVFSVSASPEHWLLLEFDLTANTGVQEVQFQVFFEVDGGGFNELQSRRFLVTPNLGLQKVVVDMEVLLGGEAPWAGAITRLRVDPGTGQDALAGHGCAFDRIQLTNDADDDHMDDDLEIYWFGDIDEADQTTDHDDNDVPDWFELAHGLNPLIDEGEKMPSARFAAEIMLAGAILVLAMHALRAPGNTRHAQK